MTESEMVDHDKINHGNIYIVNSNCSTLCIIKERKGGGGWREEGRRRGVCGWGWEWEWMGLPLLLLVGKDGDGLLCHCPYPYVPKFYAWPYVSKTF
jgi:hypothetical protein